MKNRIGIIGGGQLGRMLAMSAKTLGFYVTVLDPTPNSPAGQVVDKQIIAELTDEKAIQELACNVDFLTFEIELANATILEKLTKEGIVVNPSPTTLYIIKDKFTQKQFLRRAGLPVTEHVVVDSHADIKKAGVQLGYPLLLKARFDAYDGRGNVLVTNEDDIPSSLEKLKNRKLYVEKFVPFVKELAVMVARNTVGEIVTYPVVETVHKNHICHIVYAPARVNNTILKKANTIAKKTMKELAGAGVFGIELFLTKKGTVLINEIAPRVHNSGHYTIEACVTSQFEQHIRAITGLPLGKTQMIVSAAVMINILGDRRGEANVSGLEKVLQIPNTHVHIYGKTETKPERKMGHITVVDTSLQNAYNKAKRARNYISI